MTTRLINIVGGWLVKAGPSREELFDALRLYNERRELEFTLEAKDLDVGGNRDRYCLKTRLEGIAVEDGSGHSWLLRVVFYEVENQLALVNHGPFELYYHDKDRRGVVLSDLRLAQSAA